MLTKFSRWQNNRKTLMFNDDDNIIKKMTREGCVYLYFHCGASTGPLMNLSFIGENGPLLQTMWNRRKMVEHSLCQTLLGEVVDIYKMAEDQPLPFKVGQLAESRSFVIGFRSAWFRCKIKKVLGKRSPVHYAMEYFDFPDEKIRLMRLYQKPPKKSNTKEEKLELMVRPHYPEIYRESEMPDVETISEVIVVTDCAWKVGDLVDWFTDGCFWSGRVTEIVDDNMVKIELPEPPIGEGSVYEVFCKDLRPSLDWSPEFGWTIPESMATERGHVCARLIQPVGQARSLMPVNTTQHYRGNDILKHSTIISEDEMQAPGTNADVDVGYSDIGKSSCSDCVSSSCVKDVSAEVPRPTLGNEQYSDNETSKKLRLDESIPINSLSSDSIESTIMDLEELVNKVKWLKRILEFGIPLPSVGPAWNFLEYLGVSTPQNED